jgi:tetratricopeptide (TPR) repeat protein
MKNMRQKTLMVIVTIMLFSSCEKFLDAKPDQALATPSTLKDLEAIINNFNVNNLCPNAGDMMSDDYYLEETTWKAITDVTARDTYIFGDQTYQDFDWQFLYSLTFKANVCLDEIDKIKVSPSDEFRVNNIKGSALFLRGFALYHLAQTFCLPYQKLKANETLGVPLKLSSDLNEPILRSSLADTYEEMIKDFTAAAILLPNTREFRTQPSKAACYGQLARVYLVMGDFENALKYADLGLSINATLMDFNTLNASAQNPITIFNTEVDFNATSSGRGGVFNTSRARVNTVLYNSYASNDLRKVIFYSKNSNGSYAFKGDYVGRNNGQLFAGLTVDENLLIKAEAEVRLNKVNEGLITLNKLLIKRWKTGTFIPLTASNQADALKLVLLERRKELAFRCDVRWADIKRLSFDADNSIVVNRTLGVDTYTLKVGDLRYASLIPLNTISLSSIIQNER